MSKKPRFFCDNCGAEVDKNSRSCARCGRFFSSVRCPSCGYSGDENAFSGGCPSCGYSAPAVPSAQEKKPGKHLVPAGPLPLWIYLLSVFAFIAVLALLIVKLLH